MGVSKVQLGSEPNTTWSPRTRNCRHLHTKATFLLCLSPVITSKMPAIVATTRPEPVLVAPKTSFSSVAEPVRFRLCGPNWLLGCLLAHPVEPPPLRPRRSHADYLQPPCLSSGLSIGTIESSGALPQLAPLLHRFRADNSFQHLNTLTARTATANMYQLLWYYFLCPILGPLRTLSYQGSPLSSVAIVDPILISQVTFTLH